MRHDDRLHTRRLVTATWFPAAACCASTLKPADGSGGAKHVFHLAYKPDGAALPVVINVTDDRLILTRKPDFDRDQVVGAAPPVGTRKEGFAGSAWNRSWRRLRVPPSLRGSPVRRRASGSCLYAEGRDTVRTVRLRHGVALPGPVVPPPVLPGTPERVASTWQNPRVVPRCTSVYHMVRSVSDDGLESVFAEAKEGRV